MEGLWKDLSCNLKQASKAILVQTDNAGRGLVATENIQRDDVILTETPVISGPPQSIGPHFCANCSQPLTDGVLQGMFFITIIFFNTSKHFIERWLLGKAINQNYDISSLG